MTDTPSSGAGADARVRGIADALAGVIVNHVDKPLSADKADTIFAAAGAAPTAPTAAKSAAQSSTILAAITGAGPALVLLADDAGRIVRGPALGPGRRRHGHVD